MNDEYTKFIPSSVIRIFPAFSYLCKKYIPRMSPNEELVTKVKNVLEQIRPYLQADGGDVEFVDMAEDKTVNIRLLGMCGNCPHSRMTLKNGIEAAVKRVLPEIRAVESVSEDLTV
jgi:Fe-S cluster biogenesis protein NfuA